MASALTLAARLSADADAAAGGGDAAAAATTSSTVPTAFQYFIPVATGMLLTAVAAAKAGYHLRALPPQL